MDSFEEFLKCRNSFKYFAENYIKITHPTRGRIPFKLFEYQERLLDHYEKNRFTILTKFRQGGFTTLTIYYAMWKCMFFQDQRILAIAKTDREACKLGKLVTKARQSFPEWLDLPLDIDNDHEKRFTVTNSRMNFHTAQGCRSCAATLLIIDEAAFIPNMHDKWAALYPIIATGGNLIVLSTTNGVGNWFEETYTSAWEKKNNFSIFECSYTDHPDYKGEEWKKEMKRIMGEKGWLQEVECKFLIPNSDSLLVAEMNHVQSYNNKELSQRLKGLLHHHKDDLQHYSILLESARRLSELA